MPDGLGFYALLYFVLVRLMNLNTFCILQFVSSLQSLAASRILETFPPSISFEDLPIPKALGQELALLSKLQSKAILKNF